MVIFDNVSKSFGGKVILEDISFEVKKGETLFVVGPSGTGKSVSVKQLLGIFQPNAGKILVDQENYFDLNNKQKKVYHKKFGVLFQSSALMAWMTIGDNIALPLVEEGKLLKKEIDAKVQKAMDLVSLKGCIDKYPNEISGGMQKRVGIARAFITNPEIIIYDEPTSGLDPVTSRQIDYLINDMKEHYNTCSIVVTHDLNSVLIAGDKVVMLYDKKLLSYSTVNEFFTSKNSIIKEFIEAQFLNKNNLLKGKKV